MTSLAVVTGCSTGIGRSTAELLHEKGYDVVATMRNPDMGKDLPCRVEPLDVNDDASVAALFDRLGPVDVLVNNAGIPGPGPCEEVPVEEIKQVFETNFFGAIRCIQAVLPSMRERGAGAIVNVTSIAGRFAAPAQGAYNASKFALEGWTETLAGEVAGFGVRVVLIEPGVVITPIFGKVTEMPSGPYAAHGMRLITLLLGQFRNGTTPAQTAEVILESITTAEGRLRWVVGPDAEVLEQALLDTTAEQRIAMAAIADDDAYWAEVGRLLGPQLLPQA
jgi:NAD(P)-dependent dehydrogenase (short-subunit alcohol dehydrogenase family)